MESNIYYRRNLPHYQPHNSTFFVTFRLVNSLPKSVIEKLREEQEIILTQMERIKNRQEKIKKIYAQQKRYFGKFEKLLDGSTEGSLWLKNSKIAKIVSASIHFYNKNKYYLYCYCIMPNHVHMLVKANNFPDSIPKHSRTSKYYVTKILQDLKKFSAKEANKILMRNGQFWHSESYDHVVRDEVEFKKILNYIVQNPVKAKLVRSWKEWQWTYVDPKLISFIEP